MGNAYFFNMIPDTMYVTVNGSGPQLTVDAIGDKPPYTTLGTPQKLPRSQGSPKQPGHFSDDTTFSWYFDSDSNERSLSGVSAPEAWDVELDVQVYFFKNSVVVRYGDNATFFSPSGSQPA